MVYALPIGSEWLGKVYKWLAIESYTDPVNKDGVKNLKLIAEHMRERCPVFQLKCLERIANEHLAADSFAQFVRNNNDNIRRVIEEIKPDLIMIDFYVQVPAVIVSGIPWVLVYSANPLRCYGNDLKAIPRNTGFSINDDVDKFMEIRQIRSRAVKEVHKSYREWLIKEGIADPPEDHEMGLFSPYLNVYSYPEELDYKEFQIDRNIFHRLDHCLRPVAINDDDCDDGEVYKFLQSDGKKIYFSLGSMASAQVHLMQRLINIMAKSPHKFIVSKGFFHDEIKLPSNMIGSRYLNQLKVLPFVDLVITHGGNNTFVESCYFGKRMLVLPIFGDQPDNGRRLDDLKLGKFFDPWTVDEESLLGAISELINDEQLEKKFDAIGKRMRESKCAQELMEKLVKLVK